MDDTLAVVLACEVIILIIACLVLWARTLWLLHRTSRLDLRMQAARMVMVQMIEWGYVTEVQRRSVSALSFPEQVQLIEHFGSILVGQSRTRLSGLTADMGLTAKAERLCRSRRWRKRLKGIQILTVLGQGADVVPAMVSDPSPIVRAHVARWVVSVGQTEHVSFLYALLKDPHGICRFCAQDALHRLGAPIIDSLIDFIAHEKGDGLLLALEVAALLRDDRFAGVAYSGRQALCPRVRRLSVLILGTTALPQAAEALLASVEDADADVRAAAAQGLAGLRYWPAAPVLFRLLQDPSWVVRRASAMALRELGGPGLLFLHRAYHGADRYAADMAEYILKQPLRAAHGVSA